MDKKMISVNGQMCIVESLREWINGRITHIRQSLRSSEDLGRMENLYGRLAELLIIREKINDGRIDSLEPML